MAANMYRLLRHLLPSRGASPVAFGRNVVWVAFSCLVLTYLALMPYTLLPGVGLGDFTSLFFSAAGLALAQIMAIIAGTWLLYGYLYAVVVPVVRAMEQGRPLAHLSVGFTGAKFLRVLIRLAHAWALIIGVLGREPAPYLTPILLRSLVRRGIPGHLATGWRAGTHPQVLYA